MKLLFPTACLFYLSILFSVSTFAENQWPGKYQFWHQNIDQNRLILQLSDEVGKEEKNDFIEHLNTCHSSLRTAHFSKNLVLLYLQNETWNNNYHLIQFFQNSKLVEHIAPYLRHKESGAESALLNPLFLKIKDSNKQLELEALIYQNQWGELTKNAYIENGFTLFCPKQKEENPFQKLNILDIAVQLEQSNLLEFVEPNFLLRPTPSSVNDEFFENQWHIQNTGSTAQGSGTFGADMEVVDAWWYTTGDPNIKIAVLDSGTDTNHVDLKNNLLPGYDSSGNGTNGYPLIDNTSEAHGTACAGIIAAEGNNEIGGAGVAYDCSIIPVKLFVYIDTISIPGFEDLPYSTSEWMVNSIGWATFDAGADVLSNSWSLVTVGILPGEPSAVEAAITNANTNGRDGKGLPLLFSSGNDGNAPYWPGSLENTITVNATSMCDERKSESSCDGEPWAGNWGGRLDISAPGVLVTTCDPMGANGYSNTNYTASFNGTSAACPNAAAVMALMYSTNADLNYDQALEILCKSAEKVGSYDYDSLALFGDWSPELGYGRVNALNAVIEALLTSPEALGTDTPIENTTPLFSLSSNLIQANNMQLKLNFELAKNEMIDLKIVSLNGQTLWSNQLQIIAGKQQLQIPVPLLKTWPTGSYLISVNISNHKVMTQKFMLFH